MDKSQNNYFLEWLHHSRKCKVISSGRSQITCWRRVGGKGGLDYTEAQETWGSDRNGHYFDRDDGFTCLHIC